MLNKFLKSFLPGHQLLNLVEMPMAGLLLTLGLTTINLPLPGVDELEIPGVQQQTVVTSSPAPSDSQESQISDGIYLYGQSLKPEQLGQEYLVFESRGGKVVGAFYMPASEFNCFYGTLDAQQMSLSVVDPYEQTTHAYSIARQSGSQIASEQLNRSNSVELKGYHPVNSISDNDQQILSVCRDNYQQQVWK